MGVITRRDLVNDIRSAFPKAGVLNKTQIGAYLHKKKDATTAFLRDVPKTNTGNKVEYLVIDIADKLYRNRA